MSAATTTPPQTPRASVARPSLWRLTRVELRKAVDTRAGFWLLLSIAALVVLIVVAIAIWGHARDQRLHEVLRGATTPVSVLLPIVGILLVSSEWSQRTTLITFALVPQRWRIVAAKLCASLVLAIVAVALCLVASLVSTAVADGAFALSAIELLQMSLFVVASMVIGVAFGAAILSSAPAIVLSFVLPIAYAFLGHVNGLHGLARWTDQSRSLDALNDHALDATEWGRVATTLVLWLVVPLAIGMWRIARSDAV